MRVPRLLPWIATVALLASVSGVANGQASDGPAATLPVATTVDLPWGVLLEPARPLPSSRSGGQPNAGYLVGAVALPLDAPHLFVLRDVRSRGTNFASAQMAALLEHTGRYVAERHADTRLGLGNVAVRDGGRIRWSRSHQNGRDADLSFVFVNAQGVVVEAPHLWRVLPDLTVEGAPGVRLDPARNWTVVEGLLSAPGIDLEWVFASEPIIDALLAAGLAAEAPPEVLRRAAAVLRQPGDSLPHDDHFHVRVLCTTADRVEGCAGYGPIRQEVAWDRGALARRVDALLFGMVHATEPESSLLAERLTALAPREISAHLAARVAITSGHAQAHLLRLIAQAGQPDAVPALAAYAHHASLEERHAILSTLAAIADPAATAPLLEIASAFAHDPATLAPALLALANTQDLRAVQYVASLVAAPTDASRTPVVEAAIARVARRIAAVDLQDPGQASALWAALSQPGVTREQLLAARAGVDVDAPYETLLSQLGHPEPLVAYAADRLLWAKLGGWTPLDGWSVARRQMYWARRLVETTRNSAWTSPS